MVIQTIMACLGSVGFGMVFNVRGRRLWLIAFGGGLGWAVYLGGMHMTGNVFTSVLLSTAVVTALSEVLARVIETPIILLMVPMLIPLIPGGALYYTMSYLVRDDYPAFVASLQSLLTQAGAIAVGMIIMTSIMTNFFAIYYRRKRNRNK